MTNNLILDDIIELWTYDESGNKVVIEVEPFVFDHQVYVYDGKSLFTEEESK